MDFLRTSLIVGLLVVSYLLVLEWNEEMIPQQQPVSQTASVSIDSGNPDSSVASNTSSGELDTPESASTPAATTIDTGAASVSSMGKIITVTTDVLRVKIDLNGGNIVETSLLEYPISLKNPTPLDLMQKNNGVYYVAESSLVGPNGFDDSRNGGNPIYTSEKDTYLLADGQNKLGINLKTERNGVTVVKHYEFEKSSYSINVAFQINNQSDSPWKANFSAKLRRDKSPDPSSSGGFGASSYLGAVISTAEKPYEKVNFKDMDENGADGAKVDSPNGWIAFIQHYFVSAWVPLTSDTHTYQTRVNNGLYLMGFVDPAFTVEPGQTHTVAAKLYAGPKIMETLKEVAPNLDLTVDFGWLWLIAKPLYLVLEFIHDFVGNWGISIILLTVLIKALFFHLSATSYRSMANMRRVTPEMQRIREQHGDDRQRMSQAMMELYKKEKINPLGGCLPMIVQMPVFISLYWVLLESVQLRQAPFFFWIQDLSIKDPYFVLPLLMGAAMFLQTSLNPTPPDPIQARVMKMMPIIFTVFFLWFPAGLVLYWLVNNILSIAQQWYITKKIENEALAAKK
ncbi:membrane protein insertase YidC [Hahella sp. KA22]|uniref:membrane protein insertase YidC n=1 Tax=Hahella sp. KA22 TaxID=1628392 RepID=UPI000FDED9A3|nr:membrane protein insertase YidC [Hahella sp. KA22]AZZ95366.1 membrane protein insertase YidC [Hahella sp. KA22]QAY53011.1 membrane protein insertase YidC [Hahella sp. KA22]